MQFCVITFRSVTPAQRGEGVLRQGGIHCNVQRTPRWMEEQGCGYSLRLRCADLPAAVQLLRMGNIPFRKFYALLPEGKMEEVQL